MSQISRLRVLFEDPRTEVNTDDLTDTAAGKYATAGLPLSRAWHDGRQAAVTAVNTAYNFGDDPLRENMFQAMELYSGMYPINCYHRANFTMTQIMIRLPSVSSSNPNQCTKTTSKSVLVKRVSLSTGTLMMVHQCILSNVLYAYQPHQYR